MKVDIAKFDMLKVSHLRNKKKFQIILTHQKELANLH